MASVLKVDKLDPQSGTALEIGTSGDTITIPSGATIVNSGTATGFGGDNTPAFQVRNTSNQDVSDGVSTQMTFNTEDFDTDSAFASDTFTVPSGEGGKYFMYAKAKISCGTVNTLNSGVILFRINDAERQGLEFFGSGIVSGSVEIVQAVGLNITATLTLSAADTVKVYAYSNVTSGQAQFQAGDGYSLYFGGYKLIGV
jgi:hypothetical protein